MQVEGRIKKIYDTQKVSEKYSIRNFVLTIDESTPYPQHVSIQVRDHKCALLDFVQEGQLVTVSIELRGRQWQSPQGETKYFNTIEAWRIVHKESFGSKTPETPINNINDSSLHEDSPF